MGTNDSKALRRRDTQNEDSARDQLNISLLPQG
jgi:hypothetical protein